MQKICIPFSKSKRSFKYMLPSKFTISFSLIDLSLAESFSYITARRLAFCGWILETSDGIDNKNCYRVLNKIFDFHKETIPVQNRVNQRSRNNSLL